MRNRSKRNGQSHSGEIFPDEIFLDAKNLPDFNVHQFEGRIEKAIPKQVILIVGIFFLFIIAIFAIRTFYLEIVSGQKYFTLSERNHLKHTPVFSDRGIITDRTGLILVNNIASTTNDYALRHYTEREGFSHLLGYVKYPLKDASGFYYEEEVRGIDGLEKANDDALRGTNGIRIVEINAQGVIESRNVIESPKNGNNLTLSIDANIQEKLYQSIKSTAHAVGFGAGAGVIMNVNSGEVLAMSSYPEFSSQALSLGTDEDLIKTMINDDRKPFLNRVTDGVYTPGSIMKLFIAIGALTENIIDPETEIVSTGSIAVANPFDPAKKSVFMDWKAHGAVDMRTAIAVSSNVYFYSIGGGYENQPGLGISRIEKYYREFGFGDSIKDAFFGGEVGTIPNPEWKKVHFDGDEWRLGDTYNTSIGQYGVQVTPIQAVRAVAAIANGGWLLTPTIKNTATLGPIKQLDTLPAYYSVVKEGMREAVLSGTAQGLNIPGLTVAAKTGTAEIGTTKQYVNSWVVGFYPYESPEYAFAIIMEKGPRDNLIGALYVARELFEWMAVNTPEYLGQ